MSSELGRAIGAALMAGLALPGAARADTPACVAAIQSVGATPVVQYDPFRSGIASAELAVRIVVAGDPGACSLGLSAAGLAPGAGRTMASGSDMLIYRLFYRGIELGNDPDAYVPIELDGDQREIALRLEVPAGQIGPAGTYSDPLVLRLVDRGAGNARLGTEASALVTTAMESRAEVNIAGGSTAPGPGFGLARVDLGALRLGGTRSVVVQVRSTAPVMLAVTSENRGVLRRIGGADSIAYGLSLDSHELVLGSGSDSLMRGAASTPQGAAYPLTVSVRGDPELAPAGEYRTW